MCKGWLARVPSVVNVRAGCHPSKKSQKYASGNAFSLVRLESFQNFLKACVFNSYAKKQIRYFSKVFTFLTVPKLFRSYHEHPMIFPFFCNTLVLQLFQKEIPENQIVLESMTLILQFALRPAICLCI